MSTWPAAKARRVFAALLRIGVTDQAGAELAQVTVARGLADYVFAFMTVMRSVRACSLASHGTPVSRLRISERQSNVRYCRQGRCGSERCAFDVLDLLAAGLSPERVIDELPDLALADVTACLRFASRRVDHPILAA